MLLFDVFFLLELISSDDGTVAGRQERTVLYDQLVYTTTIVDMLAKFILHSLAAKYEIGIV